MFNFLSLHNIYTPLDLATEIINKSTANMIIFFEDITQSRSNEIKKICDSKGIRVVFINMVCMNEGYTYADKTIVINEGITDIETKTIDIYQTCEKLYLPKSLKSISNSILSVLNNNVNIYTPVNEFYIPIPHYFRNSVYNTNTNKQIKCFNILLNTNLESLFIEHKGEFIERKFPLDSDIIQFFNDNGINMIDSEVFNYVVEYLQIPEGVHTLMDKAFNSNNGLKHITFPSTLTNIGVQAFQFTNIEYVDLSNTNVEIIKTKTFLGCNVEVIKLPHCLTKIENSAFEGCTRLKYIHLHKTKLESIGEEAFFKCVNLTEITFPTSLSFIGKKAFVYTSIKSLYLDKTILEEIPYQMCIGVKTLVDITYPITLRKINNGAFAGTSINQSLPMGVEYIGSESFYNCVNMQNLNFSSYTNLKTVYADSFINCGSETIILPNHITKFDMDITTKAILFTNTNHDYYRGIDFSNYKFLKKLFISAIYMHKIPNTVLNSSINSLILMNDFNTTRVTTPVIDLLKNNLNITKLTLSGETPIQTISDRKQNLKHIKINTNSLNINDNVNNFIINIKPNKLSIPFNINISNYDIFNTVNELVIYCSLNSNTFVSLSFDIHSVLTQYKNITKIKIPGNILLNNDVFVDTGVSSVKISNNSKVISNCLLYNLNKTTLNEIFFPDSIDKLVIPDDFGSICESLANVIKNSKIRHIVIPGNCQTVLDLCYKHEIVEISDSSGDELSKSVIEIIAGLNHKLILSGHFKNIPVDIFEQTTGEKMNVIISNDSNYITKEVSSALNHANCNIELPKKLKKLIIPCNEKTCNNYYLRSIRQNKYINTLELDSEYDINKYTLKGTNINKVVVLGNDLKLGDKLREAIENSKNVKTLGLNDDVQIECDELKNTNISGLEIKNKTGHISNEINKLISERKEINHLILHHDSDLNSDVFKDGREISVEVLPDTFGNCVITNSLEQLILNSNVKSLVIPCTANINVDLLKKIGTKIKIKSTKSGVNKLSDSFIEFFKHNNSDKEIEIDCNIDVYNTNMQNVTACTIVKGKKDCAIATDSLCKSIENSETIKTVKINAKIQVQNGVLNNKHVKSVSLTTDEKPNQYSNPDEKTNVSTSLCDEINKSTIVETLNMPANVKFETKIVNKRLKTITLTGNLNHVTNDAVYTINKSNPDSVKTEDKVMNKKMQRIKLNQHFGLVFGLYISF